MTADGVIRVLHSLPPPDGRTRFVDQMIGGATDGVQVQTFSWKRALTGSYDIFHVHWPEYLIRHRTAAGRATKRLLALMLLVRLRLLKVPIVRTAHNMDPHEGGGRLDTLLLQLIDDRTGYWIRLNPTTTLPPGARVTTILHGHYRDRFRTPGVERVPGRLLQFGLIRPYKGIEQLLAAFDELLTEDLSLRIVGQPVAGDLDQVIRAAADADPRISHDLRFVDDDELVNEVSAAEVVVLPYREMHNSGALLVALSLDRPVLVPRSASNEAIAAEVGDGWVTMFDGQLGPHHLDAAVHGSHERSGRPELRTRDWDEVGRRHEAAYRQVLSEGGARVTASTNAARG